MIKEDVLDALSSIRFRVDILWDEVEMLSEISSSEYERLYEEREKLLETIKNLEDKINAGCS